MKRKWSYLLLLSILGYIWAVQAENNDVVQNQLTKTVYTYLEIKDALVNGNSAEASESAAAFLKELSKVDAGNLSDEMQGIWQEKVEIMKENADQLKSAESIEDQRMAFGKLSETVGFVAKKFGPLNTTLYRQYCPMAFNSKGGQWLSNSNEIKNPYFGLKMMKCGKVVEKLTIDK